jgi:hypothetical protein
VIALVSRAKPQPNQNPKSESRNPKQAGMLKIRILKRIRLEFLYYLIIWICFEFRISSFEVSNYSSLEMGQVTGE